MNCTTPGNAKRFNVNFYGPNQNIENLIYHLDFRFDYFNEINTIVSNVVQNGKYGPGQRTKSPVLPGSSFDLMIVNNGNYFLVFINDIELIRFDNVKQEMDIGSILIEGEVSLSHFSCPRQPKIYKPVSGLWRGEYEQYGQSHYFDIHVEFTANHKITGKGSDGIGDFTIDGTWEDCGQVQFLKQYIGQHNVDYAGTLQGDKKIVGKYWGKEDFVMNCIEPAVQAAPAPPPAAAGGLFTISNPPMPFSHAYNFEVGHFIAMHCSTQANAKRFHFNLKGANAEDLVFHLDFRFNYFNQKNTIVCNSLLEDAWGKEERHPMPCGIAAGASFVLAIVKQQTYFEVYLNGQHAFNFENRAASSGVVTKFIHIVGEVAIMSFSCHSEMFSQWWSVWSVSNGFASGGSSSVDSESYSSYIIWWNGSERTFSSQSELEAFRNQNGISGSYWAVYNGCLYSFASDAELQQYMQKQSKYVIFYNGRHYYFHSDGDLGAFRTQYSITSSYTANVNGVHYSFGSKAELEEFMAKQKTMMMQMHGSSSSSYTATVNGVKHSFNSQEELDAFMAEQRSSMMQMKSGGSVYKATVNGEERTFSSKEEMEAFMQSQMGMMAGMHSESFSMKSSGGCGGAYTATVNGVQHSFNSQEEMDEFMAQQRSSMMGMNGGMMMSGGSSSYSYSSSSSSGFGF